MLTREQVKAALEEVGAAAKEIGKKCIGVRNHG